MIHWRDTLCRALGRPASWLCAIAVVSSVVVYANALHNPFVYDDFHIIVENRALERFPDILAVVLHDAMRPLAGISWAIDRALWGAEPIGFHVSSLAWHLLNIVLVFAVSRRGVIDAAHPRADAEDRALVTATIAATIFAVHPALTQAVGYIGARADLLCASASLATLLVFRHAVVTGRARWYVATLVGWIIAIGAKEVGVMLPPLLFVYDALLLSNRGAFRRRARALHLPLVAGMALIAASRLAVLWRLEGTLHPAVHWPNLLVGADVVRRYVSLLFLAAPQGIYHAVPALHLSDPRAIFAVGWLATLVILGWRAGTRDRLVAFGSAWFLAMLAPPALLVVLNVGEPMAEHRLYVPSIGAVLACAAPLGALWARLKGWRLARSALAAAMILLVALLGQRTIARNDVWSDPVRLWRESAERAPEMWWPQQMLGEALQQRGRCDEAVEAFRTAAFARPEEPQPYLRAGMCLTALKRLSDAAAAFEAARHLMPSSSRPLLGLGTVALLAGRSADAQHYFDQAIACDPGNHELRASIAQLTQGRFESLPAGDAGRMP
jgi:protein O-mannosyl-transferase